MCPFSNLLKFFSRLINKNLQHVKPNAKHTVNIIVSKDISYENLP